METKTLNFDDIKNLSMEEKLKRTDFFVEASGAEQHFIWGEFIPKPYYRSAMTGAYTDKNGLEWIQDTAGFGKTLGNIGAGKSRPVVVDFSWYIINGRYVCFYRCNSRFCDWTMIGDWIKNNFPVKYDNGQRSAMTDAANFIHCYHFCQG